MSSQIFDSLTKIAPLIPVPLYWLDSNLIFRGGNQLCAMVTGAKSLDDFIGKSWEDVHPHDIAKPVIKNMQLVIQLKKMVETEEEIYDLKTGKKRYFIAYRVPLFDDEGKNVIGIIATSVEITAQKEAERLTMENTKHRVALDEQKKFGEFMTELNQIIRAYTTSSLNEKIGTDQQTINSNVHEIGLTKMEHDVLYLLSHNKSARNIADYLTKIYGKNISLGLIIGIIKDHLYPKFKVKDNNQLIEQALRLKIIPFMPESFK